MVNFSQIEYAQLHDLGKSITTATLAFSMLITLALQNSTCRATTRSLLVLLLRTGNRKEGKIHKWNYITDD